MRIDHSFGCLTRDPQDLGVLEGCRRQESLRDAQLARLRQNLTGLRIGRNKDRIRLLASDQGKVAPEVRLTLFEAVFRSHRAPQRAEILLELRGEVSPKVVGDIERRNPP